MSRSIAVVQPADDRQFNLIVKQWGEHSENQISKLIDKRFIPLIKRINADPDMATMYCCSGHIKLEMSYDPEEISSYMVIVARGKRVKDLQKMVNHIESRPGYIPLARIHGWSVCTDDIMIVPWIYPIEDIETVKCLSIYYIDKMADDPTGMLTMQKWDDLFNKFIFKEAV